MTDQQLKAWELTLQRDRDAVTAAKYARELSEIERHNLAYETETQRHNRATEDAALQQLGVSWHQAQSSRISAEANRQNAGTNAYNAQINAWNAAINERNAETNRMNAETNREALGPAWLSAQAAYLHGQAGMYSAEVAARNAEYNLLLGGLNYSLGKYRAETDRYGAIQAAKSNRMQAQAQTSNAQARMLEYQLAAKNSIAQRSLWSSQAESNRVQTQINRNWGDAQAKANAYSKMADALYKSKLTDLEAAKWASSTTGVILGAATRFPMPVQQQGASSTRITMPGFGSEDSGVYLFP